MALAWFIAPAMLLTMTRTTAYIHYFIVLFPLPFIGVGYLADRMKPRLRFTALVLACVLAAAFVVTDVELARRIARDDGAPGDYGSAFTIKRSIARAIAAHAQGHRVELSGDVAGGAYEVLLWNADPDMTLRPGRVRHFTIVDGLTKSPQPQPGRPLFRIGPVRVLRPR